MKYVFYISILTLFVSCGNVTSKHKFSIIYEFENPNNVSANEKNGTVETLNNRLEKFASKYEVKLNHKQQIEIKLSTDFNLEAVNAIVTNPGKLDFWDIIKPEETGTFFLEANDILRNGNDSINPIVDLIQPNAYGYGIFSVAIKDTLQMSKYLNSKEIRQLLRAHFKRSKFLFGLPDDNGYLPLYMVKTTSGDLAFVNETHIVDARQTFSFNNRPSVSMKMNKLGADRWERMTQLAYERGSQIAITLNDVVYSAPTVSSGAISGGLTELSGNFTVEEARDFAIILSSKRRIPKLKFVNSSAITDEL